MGSAIKLVSGFVLFVIGILIAYETVVNNLVDILLLVGFMIAIVGIVLIISYFVDSNEDKTKSILKEFFGTTEFNSPSFNLSGRNFNSRNYGFDDNGPLKMRNDSYDYDYGRELTEDDIWVSPDDEYQPSQRGYFDNIEDNPKAVLNVVNRPETDADFDNQLNFTPNYKKPMKVTRKPKKRERKVVTRDIGEAIDRTEEIKRALLQDEHKNDEIIVSHEPARDIQIDINNPERLPIPKSLKSSIISDNGLLTSQEAFEQLSVNVNKEIMLEIPSLNDLSDRFLSYVPTIYSRVIIDEFDFSDISYMVLIASLLKQGVNIKTVPKVHTVNLITDDSHAMIISDGISFNNEEFGAIYSDRNSISDIRADFEKTWNIASNLDESTILNSISGGNT